MGGVIYIFTNWKNSHKLQSFITQETSLRIIMQLVIVKNNIGMGYPFRNQYELCLVLDKGESVFYRKDFSNILKMEHINHDKNSHPHEKGVKMLEKILEHSTKESDLVFDCFSGTGSVLVACKQMKRNYIGCEISKEYCDIAQARLDALTQSLF